MWLRRSNVGTEPQPPVQGEVVQSEAAQAQAARAQAARSRVSAGQQARGRVARNADVFGVAWVVLVLAAYLSPALWDGFSFGPTDVARQLSYLTYSSHLVVHNGLNGDIITQEVPWNWLDWLTVHHGQLPLWNNYSGDGMPLLLNFESSPFALSTLVGYLFPITASYLASTAVILLVAGTGTYASARLVGVGPLGAALAGTTFMLSGSLSGWVGWAVGGPLAWAGWLLAGSLLCCRAGRQRWAGLVVVALSSAFAVYEGFPETLLLVALGVGAVVAVGGGLSALMGRIRLGGLAFWAAGLGGGAALSAPLWLPGYAVLAQSSRANENGTGGLPAHALALLFAQGYDGLPTRGSTWFGPDNYYEATAYVGVVALVLALVAIVVQWRRPVVVALVAAAVVSIAVVYVPSAQHLFTRVGAGAVATQRMLPMLAFAVAMLAGLGTDTVLRSWRGLRTQVTAMASIVACGAVIAYLSVASPPSGLSPAEVAARRHALFWPTLTVAGMAAALVLVAVMARVRGPARALAGPRHTVAARADGRAGNRVGAAVCLLFLAAQSAYLVWAGIGINSYAATTFPVTAQVAKLKRLVGNNLVALDGDNKHDVTRFAGVGFYPEVNIGYGLRELAIHDPVIPPAYYHTWPDLASTGRAGLGNNIFAPAVGSALRARFYGAPFILAVPGSVPKNTTAVAKFHVPLAGTLTLYRAKGASEFVFAGGGAKDRVLAARQTGNSSWRLRVDAPEAAPLTLHLTYFPGWHVSADGRALAVHESQGLVLGVKVPAGTHTITVNYWPEGLTAGFALALAAIAVLLVGSLLVLVPPSRGR